MGLSKVNDTPTYTATLPSTGEKIKYRPFLVAEERALLTAGESEDSDTMYASLESVVKSCLQTEVNELTVFDVEYLFVIMRSKSVGDTSELNIKCDSCGKDTMTSISLKTVEVVTPENHQKKIVLSPEKIVMMKHPTMEQMLNVKDADNKEELYETLIKECLHSVYYKDDIYIISEEEEKEVDGFLATLFPSEYKQLRDFIDTVPYVRINHSWSCSNPECKSKNKTELKGIFSFF